MTTKQNTPEAKLQAAIEKMREGDVELPPSDMERGAILSSPSNTHGSVNAAIKAALLNTQAAVTSLEHAGRDLFPQAKNLYFDTDLVGIPFMIVSEPREEMRPDAFSKKANGERPVMCFQAYLLDPDEMLIHYTPAGDTVIEGYKGPDPKAVDVEIGGAYIRNFLAQVPANVLTGRVWTLDYNEKVKTVQDAPARMLRFWKPETREQQGTF